MKINIHFFIISRSFLLAIRNVSDKRHRENQNTHLVSKPFFFKIVKKYGRTGQATGENMAHAYCMLDT